MSLIRIAQPEVEPVTLEELKKQLEIALDDDSENDFLNRIASAGRQVCEEICDRSFGEQTWQLYLNDWPRSIKLERPPIKSVSSVDYYGTDGTKHTLVKDTDYLVSLSQHRIVPAYDKSWPSATLRPIDGICVEYIAGATITEREKQAILLAATWLYSHRGDEMDDTTMRAIKALIGPGVPFA